MWLLFALLVAVEGRAYAEDAESPTQHEADFSSDEGIEEPPQEKTPSRNVKQRNRREGKTQGTKALKRFESETILKSQYRDRSGKSFDVDPD